MFPKKNLFIFYFIFLICATSFSQPQTVSLNGTWDFDQTTTAFPSQNFTRKIPVPGLIHLATPKIEEYDKFFQKPDKSEAITEHSVYDIDYTPRFNWYRKKIFIAKDLQEIEAVLSLKKSQYVTQVYVNGI